MKVFVVSIFSLMVFNVFAKKNVERVPTEHIGYYELLSADDLESCSEEVEVTNVLAGTTFKDSLYFKGIHYAYKDFDFLKINGKSEFVSEEVFVHRETKAVYENNVLRLEERRCTGFGAKIFSSCFGKDFKTVRHIAFQPELGEFVARKLDYETGDAVFTCVYSRRPFNQVAPLEEDF